MPAVPPVGAPDRFPRSVRALLLAVVVVFGFAFGGRARAALDVLADPEQSPVPTAPLAVRATTPISVPGLFSSDFGRISANKNGEPLSPAQETKL